MYTTLKTTVYSVLLFFWAISCQVKEQENTQQQAAQYSKHDSLLNKYTTVKLTADLGGLSDRQKQMIPLLIEVGQVMDELFWYEAYGNKEELLESLVSCQASNGG